MATPAAPSAQPPDGGADNPGMDLESDEPTSAAGPLLQILVASGDVAVPDQSSDSLRLFRILQMLVEAGHRVSYIGRAGFGQERAAARLAALGIEVFPVDPERLRQLGVRVAGDGIDVEALLADRRFDLAWLSFYDVAEQYLPLLRAVSPFTRVLVDTLGVHHVRERRGAELTGDPAALAAAAHTRAREQAVYAAVDGLVAMSDEDAAGLRQLAPTVPVAIVSNIPEAAPPTPGFEDRHGPNVDAILGGETARLAIARLVADAVRTRFVMPAAGRGVVQAIAAFATAFTPDDPASLVLTVADGDPAAAQEALSGAAATLAGQGIDPDAVADIQIAPLGPGAVLPASAVLVGDDGPLSPAAPPERWRELARREPEPAHGLREPEPAFRHSARRRPPPRAAVLVHALEDAPALSAQLDAVRRSGLPEDIEIIIVADPAGGAGASDSGTDRLLRSLGDVRIVRGTGPLGRHQAWQLGAEATAASLVITLAPLALPAPGFAEPLLAAVRDGAAVAAPVVDGAAGLRAGPDGALWPRRDAADGTLDALPLDCLAAPRELILGGVPVFPRGEGPFEAQLAAWAAQHGSLAIASGAEVTRLPAPAATVIVCTRNRAAELPEGIALLVLAGAEDIVIVDNDSTDDTPEVAAELAVRFPGTVRVVHEPRRGLCYARNAGAAAARHDLLIYVDDDARVAPGWLNHLARALSRPGVANAGGPISALWPDERPAGWPGRELEQLLSVLDLGDTERTLVAPDVVYGANWAVRRGALFAVGGFDPQFGPAPDARINGDEVSVAWRLDQHGVGRTVYTPGAAIGHRIPADRIDDDFLRHRALCVGIERPRHARALGEASPDRLLAGAQAAAAGFVAAAPMTGELTVAEALDRISQTSLSLLDQVQAAASLGELAASVALLGQRQARLGDLRLLIDGPSLLRGVLATPASA